MTGERDSTTPAELRGVERALDALASAEASGSHGLEERVFLRSRGGLQGAPELKLAGGAERRGHRQVRVFTRMRVAAAVALCGGAVALWLAQGVQPVQHGAGDAEIAGTIIGNGRTLARLEDDVDLWLSLRTSEDLQSVGESIDFLYVETNLIGDSLGSGPELIDPGMM